jgi:hypothetical protein
MYLLLNAGRGFGKLQFVAVGPPEVFLDLATGGAEPFLTSYHDLSEVAPAELEAAAGMEQTAAYPANSVGTEDDRKQRCIRLAGIDGGRTRPRGLTPTGLTRGRCRTPAWFPHDHQVPPKSVPVLCRLRVPVGLREHLPDLQAGSGNGGACPPGLPQLIRRTPGPMDRPLLARPYGVSYVQRSALALKGSTYPPTGALSTVSTRSLPAAHAAGGTRITATRGLRADTN